MILKKILLSIIGMAFLGLGLNIVILANLGMGPFDSLTYTLQKLFNIKEFGNASFLLHMLFSGILLILVIKMKRKKTEVAIAIVSVFISTRFINIFSFVQRIIVMTNKLQTIEWFIIGFVILTIGIFLIARVNFIIAPYDKFVVLLAKKINLSLGKTRVINDSIVVFLAMLMSYTFKLGLPIFMGTVIITLGTGLFIELLDKLFGNVINNFIN